MVLTLGVVVLLVHDADPRFCCAIFVLLLLLLFLLLIFIEYLFASATEMTMPPTPGCINGKVYTTCGTACPLTCGNYQDQPSGCTLQCVIGCVCPSGMVEYEDGCVAPSDCPCKIICLINMLLLLLVMVIFCNFAATTSCSTLSHACACKSRIM